MNALTSDTPAAVRAAELLHLAADELEAHPERWQQHSMASAADGYVVSPWADDACTFCAAGMLQRHAEPPRDDDARYAVSRSPDAEAVYTAEATLAELVTGKASVPSIGNAGPLRDVAEWNDAPGRTVAEVVAKLREAAAKLREAPEGQGVLL